MELNKFNELINFEGTVIDLSNKLTALGCEDICYLDWTELIEDDNVIVATDDCGEEHIQIWFKILIRNSEGECIEASEIKVTKIEEF